MHPKIYTLDDVLPHITGNNAFLHIVKDGYSVIDYVGVGGGMFPGPNVENYRIFRECRGLIFNEHGMLISRPLSKAFNYGEKPTEDETRDWSNVLITHKLDGSMIRPLPAGGFEWRLATRKGITEVAMQAEAFLERSGQKQKYWDFFQACWFSHEGEFLTPIFEYTSRDNRIVLDYPEDSLTLLAVRKLNSGEYLNYTSVVQAARRCGIPVVEPFDVDFLHDPVTAHQTIRELKGLEGIVVMFQDTQEMVKIKADDYCNLHRIKSYIDNERSVVACLINDQLDDLIPLLSPYQLERVEKYADDFWRGFHQSRAQLHEYILEGRNYGHDKKTYAVEFVNKQPTEWRPILFWLYKEDLLYKLDVHQLNNCLKYFVKYNSQEAVNNSRWIHGAIW